MDDDDELCVCDEEEEEEEEEELRRDMNRHRGLIDFDIDYDEEEFIKQTEDWGDE
jgi:hypothetical protein